MCLLLSRFRVIISIQFGAMTAGQVASFAPDYVKAKVSAGRILDLFDRVPEIDSYSTEGRRVSIFSCANVVGYCKEV